VDDVDQVENQRDEVDYTLHSLLVNAYPQKELLQVVVDQFEEAAEVDEAEEFQPEAD
jgi:hypothetical protein